MDSVILVEDVWKQFRIPHEKKATVFDVLGSAMSVLKGRRFTYEEFWALKQVNFKLEQGESLGIIGPNGSGKSTLLKLIAKVMRPDRGKIQSNGSIVPILELGIGFHGDLTVKENALIYGIIMGISRSEIKGHLDSILDFAGLTKFEDAQLKHISSGMQVRLGFAIAVQTNADIFLVDEALAVGDIEFQQKCLNKFRELQKQGKSIVLVSHGIDLVKNFCEKTLYLDHGETRAFGASEEAIDLYLQDTKTRQNEARVGAEQVPFYVDLPKPEAAYSKTIPIRGWVVSSTKPAIDIYLDEEKVVSLQVNEPRPDVQEKYQNMPNSFNSGFSGIAHADKLEDGSHIIKFKVRYPNNEVKDLCSFIIWKKTSLDSRN